MMEPTSATGKAGALSPLDPSSTKANAAPVSATTTSATTAATTGAAASTTAAPSSTTSATSTTGLQGTSFKMPANVSMPNVQMPKALKDKTDDITNRIASTDIKRINGYMRFANLGAAILLAATCFIRMFMARSYSDFLVVIYLIFMAVGLVFIENHEQFPSLAEKVKNNFGFMFTAPGKAMYIMAIAFLAFSQGWIGTLIGIFFLFLALFNFFLIKRHPAYQAHMTQTKQTSQDQADLEAMPELRYNQSQPEAQTAHVVV